MEKKMFENFGICYRLINLSLLITPKIFFIIIIQILMF